MRRQTSAECDEVCCRDDAGDKALAAANATPYDAIVLDLLAERAPGANERPVRFVGGLLGQWGMWTRRAVALLEAVQKCRREGGAGALGLLALGQQITDANAARSPAPAAIASNQRRDAGAAGGCFEGSPGSTRSPVPRDEDRPEHPRAKCQRCVLLHQ